MAKKEEERKARKMDEQQEEAGEAAECSHCDWTWGWMEGTEGKTTASNTGVGHFPLGASICLPVAAPNWENQWVGVGVGSP